MKTTIDPGKSDIEYDASSTKPPRVSGATTTSAALPAIPD
jgi:hypothetical protein